MKRLCGLTLLLGMLACGAFAQTVDTTVCAVLKDPASFNGKTVRIKGTVNTSFDQFVVSDGDCGKDVNGIWLAYPPGTKAKSGPIAMVELAPARNFAGTAAPVARPAVTLTRDKPFKEFDSLLSQKHEVSGALCLGCARNQVQATLVGRLDGVADASVARNASGKITGLGGFGNLNAYPARLVLASVADVSAKPIDYSAADAEVKKAESGKAMQNDPNQGDMEPVATAQKVAARLSASPILTQMQTDIALLPANKEQNGANGVSLVYGQVNEISATEGAPGAQDSPDGVAYICTLNRERLPGLALPIAAMHLAQHVSDVRNFKPGTAPAPLYAYENNAWAVSATMAVAGGEPLLILPGGSVMWNATWPNDDKIAKMTGALNTFLSGQEMLTR